MILTEYGLFISASKSPISLLRLFFRLLAKGFGV